MGFSRLALRLVTQRPLEYFKNRRCQKSTKEVARSGVFTPGTYDSFFTLVGHQDQDNSGTMFWILLCCVVHLRTLQVRKNSLGIFNKFGSVQFKTSLRVYSDTCKVSIVETLKGSSIYLSTKNDAFVYVNSES